MDEERRPPTGLRFTLADPLAEKMTQFRCGGGRGEVRREN
jgi:hypothetical protein